MSSSDEITRYSSMGTTVILYQNRMEIQLPGGFFSKKETIPYRNITSIEKPPLMNCIDIKTSDGKKHRVTLVMPSELDKLKQHIESLL